MLLVIDNIYKIPPIYYYLEKFESPFETNWFPVFLQFPANRTTLDSGINIALEITVDPSLINFINFLHQSRHCCHFGHFYFFQKFSKINKRSPMFILESRVLIGKTKLIGDWFNIMNCDLWLLDLKVPLLCQFFHNTASKVEQIPLSFVSFLQVFLCQKKLVENLKLISVLMLKYWF